MTVPPQHQQLHQAALAALQAVVDNLPPPYAGMAQMLRNVHDHPEQHWPHAVYLLDLEELHPTDGLSEAQLVGWQYLAKAEGNRNYAIEVQGGPDGADCQFSKIDRGPLIDGMCQALSDPALLRQMADNQLRLAVLHISELDTLAVWLQADEPERELILTIPPAPATLKPWPAVYTIKQFQAALWDETRSAS